NRQVGGRIGPVTIVGDRGIGRVSPGYRHLHVGPAGGQGVPELIPRLNSDNRLSPGCSIRHDGSGLCRVRYIGSSGRSEAHGTAGQAAGGGAKCVGSGRGTERPARDFSETVGVRLWMLPGNTTPARLD